MSTTNNTKSKRRPKRKSRSPRRVEGTHPTTTQPLVAKRIRVFRNGDIYHKGVNVLLNTRHTHDINTFLDAISERVGLVHGVKRLYNLQGAPIRNTQQLENNHDYVASSGGHFVPLDYGVASRQHHVAFNPHRAAAAELRENSTLSNASKRSAPARLTRSSTDLRASARDRSGLSLNEQRATSTVSSNSNAKRTRSVVAPSTRVNASTNRTRSNVQPNDASAKTPQKKKKKRVKRDDNNEETTQKSTKKANRDALISSPASRQHNDTSLSPGRRTARSERALSPSPQPSPRPSPQSSRHFEPRRPPSRHSTRGRSPVATHDEAESAAARAENERRRSSSANSQRSPPVSERHEHRNDKREGLKAEEGDQETRTQSRNSLQDRKNDSPASEDHGDDHENAEAVEAHDEHASNGVHSGGVSDESDDQDDDGESESESHQRRGSAVPLDAY